VGDGVALFLTPEAFIGYTRKPKNANGSAYLLTTERIYAILRISCQMILYFA
jgi:hypothetical protein